MNPDTPWQQAAVTSCARTVTACSSAVPHDARNNRVGADSTAGRLAASACFGVRTLDPSARDTAGDASHARESRALPVLAVAVVPWWCYYFDLKPPPRHSVLIINLIIWTDPPSVSSLPEKYVFPFLLCSIIKSSE